MRKTLLLSMCILVLGAASWGAPWARKNARTKPPVKPSGIYGQVLRIGFPPINPEENTEGIPDIGAEIPIADSTIIVWRTKDHREVKRVVADKEGRYKITLPPGEYEVEPRWPGTPDPNDVPPSHETVTVWWGFYSQARTVFDAGW